MRSAVLTLLILISLQLSAFGPDKTKTLAAKGKVSDKTNNETLAGVKVTVKETGYITYTDLSGEFLILVNNKESVTLVFEYLSYEEEIKQVGRNETNSIEISLTEKR
jgi:hypothetical protein